MKTLRILGVVGAALLALHGAPASAAAEDSIKVTLLGTGTPILNVNRFGMSTLVEAGPHKLLFDAGRGAAIRLHQLQVPLRDIEAVFITHLHSDHLTGLPDLYATAPLPTDDGRRTQALPVYGPKGIDSVARGIEQMFSENNRIRGKETNAQAARIADQAIPAEGGVVFDQQGVKVTAFLVDHGYVKPAYGYRIDYAGRSVVLSGDTTYAPNLVRQAKGVDLLVHSLSIASHQLEKAYPDYVKHFYDYLANPETVAKVLSETHPRDAVFSHISLYSRGDIGRASEEEIRSRVAQGYDGSFVIGQDLMAFELTPKGVVREPYDAALRQREPVN
ncbi:MBL fold metallo-hydrolase [Pseudomonas citronellolis]|uniref:MBL fold metallo-hydrolase n=1 Tax=Pseudomonas citronellolis TaxID=53408 RepID=UPI0023E45B8C|nr:MBL fold metallo-hydrolase [Pseudomonas citronellolis]MDF3937237.1 MBL fold metallo-hydrolase [Pseudomonas citronellolis]